jgi:hypothetical protein
MSDRLKEIRYRLDEASGLVGPSTWKRPDFTHMGDDIAWLIAEVERLRTECDEAAREGDRDYLALVDRCDKMRMERDEARAEVERVLIAFEVDTVAEAVAECRLRVRRCREIMGERDAALAEVDRLKAAEAEIDRWKEASGLECGGDPDGVTPAAAKAYWESVERERDQARAELTKDRRKVEKFAIERDAARFNVDRLLGIIALADGCHPDEVDVDRIERLSIEGDWP